MLRQARLLLAQVLALLLLPAGAALAAPQMLQPYAGRSEGAAPAGLHSTPTRVRFNTVELLAMRRGDEAALTLPDGRTYTVVADLIQPQGSGITSWVGHVKDGGIAHRVIVTSGPGGSYGIFDTPTGSYRLVPGGPHDWLIDLKREPPEGPPEGAPDDQRMPKPGARNKAYRYVAPTIAPAIAGVTVPYLGKSAPTSNAVIDLMVVYTQGLANDLGGNLMTRLDFLVTRANTAYADSEIAITLRLVATSMVGYSDTTSDDTALKAITPVCTATICGSAFDPATFGTIESQRDAAGADLVMLMRDGGALSGTGLAWIGSSTPDADYMYSVVTGCTQGCDYVFIHELGHNMGNVHDRATAAWQAKSSVPPAGAYPYSFGYVFCKSAATSCDAFTPGSCSAEPECSTSDPSNLADIMSYFYNSAARVYQFSNPAVGCAAPGGITVPCGISETAADSANTALSMNNNRFVLSALKSPPATVTLSSSSNPSNAGSDVTFTASVAGANGAATGTVAFLDGTTPISGCGSVALFSGSATCTTAALAAGNHSMRANYSGDLNYAASTSGALAQSVNATATQSVGDASAVAFSPASVDFGGESMGTTSDPVQVTVTNNGSTTLTVSGLSVSGPFAQSNTCVSLDPGARCTISLTFTPAVAPGPLGETLAVGGSLTLSIAGNAFSIPLAGTAEKSLVTHYYEAILERSPDAAGKAFWEGEAARMQALGADVNEAWRAMAIAFFRSAEYAALGRDDAGFVGDLYHAFFDRAPDPDGVAYWTGQIASGMPRDSVLAAFMDSSEFESFTRSVFGASAVRAEVSMELDFYRGLLGRLPDDAGFDYWLQQLRSAQCAGASAVEGAADSISLDFVGSAEYAQAQRTNAQYVGDLYQTFLGRAADLAGLQYWRGQLDAGARTREEVRRTFLSSAEFASRIDAVVSQGCMP